MSEILVNTIKKADGTGSLSVPAESGTVVTTASPSLGRRNKVINGSMVIDQRNSGASVTITSTSVLTYTVDRWAGYGSAASKFTVQQSTTAPDDFNYSIVATSSSAYSASGSEIFKITQCVEGLNSADLRFGTASAKTITLSFWVRSSLTGTFGGAVCNNGFSRSYPFSYTISAADTWEQKTVTIAGDTSGTWAEGNAIGLQVIWSLGAGSNLSDTAGAWVAANKQSVTGATSVVGTSGATWYITGVQLEVGSVATPFEHRSYGEELALCQRYYYMHVNANGNSIAYGMYYSNTTAECAIPLRVTMRSTPSMDQGTGTNYYRVYRLGSEDNVSGFTLAGGGNTHTNLATIYNTSVSSTAGAGGHFVVNNASAYIAFDAEL